MMKTLIFFTALFLFSTSVQAQDPPQGAAAESNLRALAGESGNASVRTFNLAYEGIRGTPYLFENWKKGRISLVSGETIKNVEIKLDTYSNYLMYKNPSNNDSVFVNQSMISSFEFVDFPGKFLKVPIGDNNTYALKYARLLYDGKLKFYNYHTKQLVKADYTGAYNANRPYDEFVDEEQLFVQFPDGTLERIRTNKSSVLKTFEDQKGKIKSFMKSEKIKGRSSEEIIAIIKYYEGL